jgi:hypothetical protein
MALTSIDRVLAIPGMAKYNAAYPTYLPILIDAADRAVKGFLKRDIEEHTYTEYYSGNGREDIILRNIPVSSIENLWYDPNGFFGQGPNAFPSTGLMTQGTQYMLVLDRQPFGLPPSFDVVSNCGIVKRIGVQGSGFMGAFPLQWVTGKLAGTRLLGWPTGRGNIKVEYTAGYSTIPDDLNYATASLVAWMVRNQTKGAPLQSENLGAYSYNIMTVALQGNAPLVGETTRILTAYRSRPI